VPAQRLAKEHNITLVGREQLMELLSAGATSEYFTKQVEQLHARLGESKETLQQYAGQLDTLRRQRNEASWYLGEERAKSSQLESQLAEAGQQLRRHEEELAQWRQEADTFRKRWEESQWYLGESRARIRHLEANLSELQQAAQDLETVRHQWDEANWYLGEERQRSNALEGQLASTQQQIASFQEQLAAANERERELSRALDRLQRSLGALQAFGERRRKARVSIPEARVELLDLDGDHQPAFVGALRDLSSTGIGFETDREIPGESVRVRLSLPGLSESIESKARVMWQQPAAEQPSRYHCGCRLLGLPEATRVQIGQLIEHAHT
jgi:chromosome segregation ATPase